MNVGKELAALGRMSPKDLRTKYAEVFGEEARSGNKAWLVKRIAWRMQTLEEGDLSVSDGQNQGSKSTSSHFHCAAKRQQSLQSSNPKPRSPC